DALVSAVSFEPSRTWSSPSSHSQTNSVRPQQLLRSLENQLEVSLVTIELSFDVQKNRALHILGECGRRRRLRRAFEISERIDVQEISRPFLSGVDQTSETGVVRRVAALDRHLIFRLIECDVAADHR